MTKVTPASNVATFLQTLQKSGLIPADQWEAIHASLSQHADPKAAARELIKQGKLTGWQAMQLLKGYPKLTLGKYKLLDPLGAGELGRVYLAEHGQLGRRVAIKALSKKHTANPEILQRFLQEARRVAALDHRNLAHVYDVNQEGEQYFIVMEYVDGDDLQRLIEKGGRLDVDRTLEIARQTAEGLQHAHEQKVVHGDLKPTNLVIDKQGTVKILDIGLVELTDAPTATSDEAAQAASTSRIFRPKEQLDTRQATPTADWYSLGAVLCYLLTGKPLEGEQLCKAADELQGQRPDAPRELIELCSSLLAENPVDRPTSYDEVAAAIEKARQSSAVQKQIAAKAPASASEAGSGSAKRKGDGIAAAMANAAAATDAPKAKKPPVARPLDGPSGKSDKLVKTKQASDKPAEPAASETKEKAAAVIVANDDFPSFSINTTKKKTSTKKAAARQPAEAPVASEATEATEAESAPAPAAGKKKAKKQPGSKSSGAKSKLPLIIGGAIGGGVLVLATLVTLGIWLFGGSGDEVAAVADKAEVTAASDETTTEPEGEANPGEANPEPLEEENPMVVVAPAPVAATSADAATEPPKDAATEPAAVPDKPADPPAPDAAAADTKPEADKPAEPAKPEPAKTEPAKTDAPKADADKPKPPKSEPAKPAPAKPAPAKPAAPKPPANPFQGFATALTLPKPTAEGSESPADALAPVALGPCNVDEKALVILRLLGGEAASKGGRNRFTLDAANDGTAERDWEIRCGTGNPEENPVIATLSAKDKKLMFQWTPEGAKNDFASYLSNCLLELNAGSGRHQVALREPVVGEPIELDVEKAIPTTKWVIDSMPDLNQVEVEIAQFEADPNFKKRIDTSTILGGKGFTNLWLGPGDDQMLLAFRLDVSPAGRGLEVKAAPYVKLEGMTEAMRLSKRTMQTLTSAVQGQLQTANVQLAIANNTKDNNRKKSLKAAADQTFEQANKARAQVEHLSELVKNVTGKTKVHARVWYLADTQSRVLLLDTGGPPPAKKK